MTRDRHPKQLDPFRFVAFEQNITGKMALKDMTRLLELCESKSDLGEVSFQLESVTIDGCQLIQGHCDVVLPMVCQRCMKPFGCPVSADFQLVPVRSEKQIKQVPPQYEALLVEDEEIELLELVEDELLLKVPMTPLHDLEDCEIHQSSWQSGHVEPAAEEKKNPFAKLSTLKSDKK